jgi:hypothetical protein
MWIRTFNDLGEIVIEQIGHHEQPLDASFLQTDECWIPWDTTVTRAQPMRIRFRAVGDHEQTLRLCLFRKIGLKLPWMLAHTEGSDLQTPLKLPLDGRIGPFSSDEW